VWVACPDPARAAEKLAWIEQIEAKFPVQQPLELKAPQRKAASSNGEEEDTEAGVEDNPNDPNATEHILAEAEASPMREPPQAEAKPLWYVHKAPKVDARRLV
jgi:hypothetical protein